jgi:hypothetical protein
MRQRIANKVNKVKGYSERLAVTKVNKVGAVPFSRHYCVSTTATSCDYSLRRKLTFTSRLCFTPLFFLNPLTAQCTRQNLIHLSNTTNLNSPVTLFTLSSGAGPMNATSESIAATSCGYSLRWIEEAFIWFEQQ